MQSLAAFAPLSDTQREQRAYLLLDVFTGTPLQGNALGVLTDARGLSGEDMQRIARELNLSETIFFLAPLGEGDVRIRIFTPTSELPFAGHPVLGGAIVAGAALGQTELSVETDSGLVPVTLDPGAGRVRSGWMSQPLPTWGVLAQAPALLTAIGAERSVLPVEVYENGPRHAIVVLGSEEQVAALRPDLRAIEELGDICVNCVAGAGERWKSRMFAPSLGVPEDPATGSAAGAIAVHLARHGVIAFGQEIEIRQGGEIGRPSLLRALARGTPQLLDSVSVGGSAVIIGAGRLAL